MCLFNVKNYRVEDTCPHSILEPVKVKVNNISFQSFCVACHDLVSVSTNDPPREQTVEEQNLWVYEKYHIDPEFKKHELSYKIKKDLR